MRKLFVTLLLACLSTYSWAQGIPFIRNYSAAEYNAHKQNFDIITGADGTVYVANFEGLLYYDHSQWRMIHNRGITRITAVFRDSKGRIWAGGYNYLGYVKPDENGVLGLEPIDDNHFIRGEVQWIWERDGKVLFLVSDGKIYDVKGSKVAWNKNGQLPKTGASTLRTEAHITQTQQMERGLSAVATMGDGLHIIDQEGRFLYKITEENGLCSNNISHVTYNGHGLLWGATDNGVFAIAIPSVYSHFTQNEGLRGEVLSIARLGSDIYVGTLNGLYRQQGRSFVPVDNMTLACWHLLEHDGSLLAATADGVVQVRTTGVTQLTTSNTQSVIVVPNGFLAGETNGVYHYDLQGHNREKVSDAERVNLMLKDKTGAVWLKNMYGRIWKSRDLKCFIPQNTGNDKDEIATLVYDQDEVRAIKASAQKPFPYPLFSYRDHDGYTWLTNNKGKELYVYKNGYREKTLSHIVYPLMDFSVRAMLREGKYLWMGGDLGLNVADCSQKDPISQAKPNLYIRSIVVHGDSVIWGGYGSLPKGLELSSDDRQITIHFAVDYPSLLLKTQYRYRLNKGRWTTWDFDSWEEFNNMPHGKYLFEVQSRDAFGQESQIVSINFNIPSPVYLRWYMILLYAVLLGIVIYLLVRLRLNQLEQEKHRLESLVQERTAEVVKLEKVATVAKLTQGLIDRILNPLNYINNFAKLSQGLVKDVTANIEEEKDNMDAENYEDTMDVLSMIDGNLQKVGEHGANTSRTLKAMEEMLKDRSGSMTETDLIPLIRQDEEMLGKYFEKEIAEHHISMVFNLPTDHLMINGNAEQLSKTLMSLLGNAVYAVVKKAQRQQYKPEVALTLTQSDKHADICIRDNGIGIEQTIIDKIFDPFFTTKTTGEAAGVGLYLSKEIIQNHKGDISVKSEKDSYTEFTITLPTL